MSASAKLLIVLDARDQTKGAFSGVESSLKGLGEHGKTAGSALGSMATQVAAVGAVVGGAIVAGVGKAVGVFADFEHGMSAVASTGEEAKSRLGELSAEALKLGSSTDLAGISATDAAEAMAELARSGVSVSDQLGGATKGALLLASAGAISVGEASSIAAKAMNVFGMEGSQVAHVADVLSAGANKSATDVHQLGMAFNQSAAVANDAGLSFEELTGTLALLAQKGTEGADAGTALRTTLQRLTAPTDVARKVMDELGISVFDASGKMKPWPDIVDNLKAAFAGLTDEQRAAALQTIGGADAVRVLIPLMKEGGGAVRQWTAAVNDQGNAARTGAALNDNLAGSIDQLKAVFQTAAIQVGAKFAPAVRTAADELGKFVTKAMASPEVTKALEDLGNKGAAAITKLIAKVSDPAFQKQLKEWGTAALDTGKAIASLAGDIADKLGPPLKAAVDWFSGLDEGGKKNVITFGLVAAAAIGFRDELSTLLTVGNSVVKMFAEKAAAKALLTKANEGLAGSAGKTATSFGKVAAAAAPAATAIAEVAIVAAGSAVAAVAVVSGFAAAANAMDQSGQRAKDNTQAWNAASFAIANGGTATNGAIDGFTRLVAATGEVNPSVARLSVLWNQYVGSLQAGGQSTEAVGLHLIGLAQFITGQVAPAFEGVNNAAQPFNNTLVGLGVGAKTLAASLPTMGVAAASATAAFAAGVTEVSNYTSALAQLQAEGIVTTTAVARSAQGVTEFMLALQAAQVSTTSTAAALSDLNTFGSSAQQGLNAAAGAAMGAALAFDQINESLARLGQQGGQLGGYLHTLQAEWDALDAATKKQGNTTADQAARYAELAPLIQYLNAQIGVNKDNTVAATEAAVRQLQAIDSANAAYAQAASAAQQAAASTTQSAIATHAAADAATIASIKYNEFGQAVSTVPPAVTVDTSAAQTAATIASIKYDEFGQAINDVPKTVPVDTSAAQHAGIVAAGIMAGLRIAVESVPKAINIVANVDISGALNQIQQLRNNMPSSPAKEGPFRHLPEWTSVFDTFGDGVTRAIGQLPRLHAAVDSETADLQKKLADTASAIAKAVTDTLGAFRALSAFNPARDLPSGAQASGFLGGVADFMERFSTVASGFEEDVLKVAGQFADAASKALGIVGNGIAALGALDNFVAPLGASVSGFLSSLADFMEKFGTVAGGFEADVLETSSAFADAVGKAVGVLSGAVSGLMALTNFKAPLESVVSAFLASLADFMERFSTVAGGFEADVLAVSSAFAEGVGKAVGVLGTGVSGLMALADFAAPTQAAVSAFLASLADFMEKFATAASGFESDVLAEAARFAETVGKVVAIIGGGVEGFTKLLTFVAPSQQAIDNFVYAVFEAVRKIAEMASQMSTEGIKLAGEFGDAAGSVLTALKTGLDVFTGLAKLVVPSAKAIDDFGIAVAYTVRRLGQFGDELGKDGIKHAADFGASVQAVFGSLKSAMDVLTNLEKFKDVAAKAFDSLSKGLVAAIELAQGMVNQSKDLVLQAEEFANNMKKAAALFASGQSLGGVSPEQAGRSLGEGVASGARDALDAHSPSQVMAAIGKDVVDGLVQGMSDSQQDAAKKAADIASAVAKAITDTLGAAAALGKLDLTTLPTGGQITGILAFTRALVAEMAASATMLNEDGAKATNLFADAASKVAGSVSAAVDALTKLVGFVAPAESAIYAFGKNLRTAVNDLALLSEQVGMEMTGLAATFAEGAGKVVAVFGQGVDGFTKLIDFVAAPAAAIYAFGKNLRAAINDLALLAEQLTIETSDLAGKFADGAGKAVGVIGTGVEAFTKLKDFAGIPVAAIYAFGKAIRAFINDFALVAEQVGVDTAALAGRFADGAGKAVAVVGTAVQGFVGLATFVTPARSAVDGLMATVRYIVARFGEMAKEMSTEGTKQLGDFGAATNAVLGGVKSAIDTFIALDKAVVPRTGDLSDLVVAVQGVTRNMATAAAALGDDAIKDATAFGTAANGIFTALKAGLDLFILIDKPGSWPTTDWLQPLIELMAGVLLRGGQLLTQSQELKAIADQFSANLMQAGATFGGALGLGDWALTGNVGGGLAGGGGAPTTINNNTFTGNTFLSKDTATQQMVSGIVTTQQGRTIGYSTSG